MKFYNVLMLYALLLIITPKIQARILLDMSQDGITSTGPAMRPPNREELIAPANHENMPTENTARISIPLPLENNPLLILAQMQQQLNYLTQAINKIAAYLHVDLNPKKNKPLREDMYQEGNDTFINGHLYLGTKIQKGGPVEK